MISTFSLPQLLDSTHSEIRLVCMQITFDNIYLPHEGNLSAEIIKVQDHFIITSIDVKVYVENTTIMLYRT